MARNVILLAPLRDEIRGEVSDMKAQMSTMKKAPVKKKRVADGAVSDEGNAPRKSGRLYANDTAPSTPPPSQLRPHRLLRDAARARHVGDAAAATAFFARHDAAPAAASFTRHVGDRAGHVGDAAPTTAFFGKHDAAPPPWTKSKGKGKKNKATTMPMPTLPPSLEEQLMIPAEAPKWLREVVLWLGRIDLRPQYTSLLSALVKLEVVFGCDPETYGALPSDHWPSQVGDWIEEECGQLRAGIGHVVELDAAEMMSTRSKKYKLLARVPKSTGSKRAEVGRMNVAGVESLIERTAERLQVIFFVWRSLSAERQGKPDFDNGCRQRRVRGHAQHGLRILPYAIRYAVYVGPNYNHLPDD
ncbi:hypothetical protein C8R47DRAFT_1082856 [Mycena vitilis]|nr:hypothetical protein C8R47DRAFT_1082856 [Mycena vitilis]